MIIGRLEGRSLLAVLAVSLTAASAVPPAAADPDAPERGRIGFRTYCSNCHGAGGRGDGKVAAVLKVPPTDLTRLAADNGGVFPAERVYRAIDGREEVRGHGRREMPVWGVNFRDPGRDSDQEEEVRQRILDLVSFIDSIQEDEASEAD